MAINTSDAILKHQKNEQLRLKKYLEQVKSRISDSTGELQKFWQREEKRTQKKLESFV